MNRYLLALDAERIAEGAADRIGDGRKMRRRDDGYLRRFSDLLIKLYVQYDS
jgi:hypothetical protein